MRTIPHGPILNIHWAPRTTTESQLDAQTTRTTAALLVYLSTKACVVVSRLARWQQAHLFPNLPTGHTKHRRSTCALQFARGGTVTRAAMSHAERGWRHGPTVVLVVAWGSTAVAAAAGTRTAMASVEPGSKFSSNLGYSAGVFLLKVDDGIRSCSCLRACSCIRSMTIFCDGTHRDQGVRRRRKPGCRCAVRCGGGVVVQDTPAAQRARHALESAAVGGTITGMGGQ